MAKMVRPNFHAVNIVGNEVEVTGESDPEEFEDVISIRVVLVQQTFTRGENVDLEVNRLKPVLDPNWSVRFPLGDYKPGPALLFGIQTHRENLLTLTWAESLSIGN
jgi:hypothetical protein